MPVHRETTRRPPETAKPALMKEASDLAKELATEQVTRLDRRSTSHDDKGVQRTHIDLFVSFLQSTRSLAQLRAFLGTAEQIDRARSMNFENPLAQHTTVARIMLDELGRHPQRDVDTWLWLLGWTSRLLQTEARERERVAAAAKRHGHPRVQAPKSVSRQAQHTGGFNQLGSGLAQLKAQLAKEGK